MTVYHFPALPAVWQEEEANREKTIADLRARGYDPRDVLDEPWCCQDCGSYIPLSHRNLGFSYLCEDCNSKRV